MRSRLVASLRSWRLKAGVQRLCATVPMGQHLYRLVQSTVGGLRDHQPAAYVDACCEIMEAAGGLDALAGRRTVEVGTGWNVNLPLALHLLGAGPCVTFDATRYCRPRQALRSAHALSPLLLEAFAEREEARALSARWKRLEGCDWPELLEASGIGYRAPADAARTGLDDASRDLVYSRATLQHIPPRVLEDIFREAARILGPGGWMWHRLGLTDQFSLFDRRLSRIHYLTLSEEEWSRVAGNRYAYSNRLRLSDFVRLAEGVGFAVEVRNARVDPEALAFARAGNLHRDFADRDELDLATVAADLICRK